MRCTALSALPQHLHTGLPPLQVMVPGPKGSLMTRQFTFHGCLAPASRQSDVLKICGITQLLDAAMRGYHATIFAYGQTGSGKTYTMSGREEAIDSDDYAGGAVQRNPGAGFSCSHQSTYGTAYTAALQGCFQTSRPACTLCRWHCSESS